MISILFPDSYVGNVFEIDYAELRDKGIKIIFFDIDNTLMPFDIKGPSPEVLSLFKYIQTNGIEIAFVSNNNKERVDAFNEGLDFKTVGKADKPLPFKLLKILKSSGFMRKQAVIIGDQVFTDVLCGKLSGVHSILVKPITIRDQFSVKLKRGAERLVLKRYMKMKSKKTPI